MQLLKVLKIRIDLEYLIYYFNLVLFCIYFHKNTFSIDEEIAKEDDQLKRDFSRW